jgi:hypothetical protein
MSVRLTSEFAKEFALAGNATMTLQSGATGVHYTYKITKHKDSDNLYFVRLLHGPDNEEDYQYIGCYYSDTEYFNAAKPWKERPQHAWPASLRAIKYFFEHINNIPDNLFVYHEGRCGKCGRKLTTPESIERGFGPECMRSI